MSKTSEDLFAQPYEFPSRRHDIVFAADRLDFRNGVIVTAPMRTTDEELLQAHGEMLAHHRNSMELWSNNSTFAGYQHVKYTIIRT